MKRSKQLEEAVAKLLTVKGYKFWRVDSYRCFKCGQVQNPRAVGMPDFIVWYPKIMFIEVKTGSGRLSAEQQTVKLLSKGRFILVRDNIDELLKNLEE